MSGEFENSFDLFTRQAVKQGRDLVNGEAIFQVFENSGHRNSSAAEDPSPAEFSGYAFYRRTS